jgi:Putative transposase
LNSGLAQGVEYNCASTFQGESTADTTRATGTFATHSVAEALGVSVYAKQRVHGHDRAQLTRLCRYVMRPLSQEWLER